VLFVPASFAEQDVPTLHEFMDAHGFATLISPDAADPWITQLPLLLQRDRGPLGTLEGHLARANGHWQRIAGNGDVLVLFQGPHCYVSPSLYATHPSVPTWNYASVHAHGRARLVEDGERAKALMRKLVERSEHARPAPWTMDLPLDYLNGMMRGIVGIEIEITRLQGKFKLSQNRPEEDRVRVMEDLERGAAHEREVARMMRRTGAKREI
jgi:transcriptional regulator